MAGIGFPDIIKHNNPDNAVVDSDFVRGGGRVVPDLDTLYALVDKVDQLKQDVTIVRVRDVDGQGTIKDYRLIDINQIGAAAGWLEETNGAIDVTAVSAQIKAESQEADFTNSDTTGVFSNSGSPITRLRSALRAVGNAWNDRLNWLNTALRSLSIKYDATNLPELTEDGHIAYKKWVEDIVAAVNETSLHPPVALKADVAALDTTSATDYPDKWLIYVSENNSTYAFKRDSIVVANGDTIIEPSIGPGRWLLTNAGNGFPTGTEKQILQYDEFGGLVSVDNPALLKAGANPGQILKVNDAGFYVPVDDPYEDDLLRFDTADENRFILDTRDNDTITIDMQGKRVAFLYINIIFQSSAAYLKFNNIPVGAQYNVVIIGAVSGVPFYVEGLDESDYVIKNIPIPNMSGAIVLKYSNTNGHNWDGTWTVIKRNLGLVSYIDSTGGVVDGKLTVNGIIEAGNLILSGNKISKSGISSSIEFYDSYTRIGYSNDSNILIHGNGKFSFRKYFPLDNPNYNPQIEVQTGKLNSSISGEPTYKATFKFGQQSDDVNSVTLTADRNLYFPNKSGTIATLEDTQFSAPFETQIVATTIDPATEGYHKKLRTIWSSGSNTNITLNLSNLTNGNAVAWKFYNNSGGTRSISIPSLVQVDEVSLSKSYYTNGVIAISTGEIMRMDIIHDGVSPEVSFRKLLVVDFGGGYVEGGYWESGYAIE